MGKRYDSRKKDFKFYENGRTFGLAVFHLIHRRLQWDLLPSFYIISIFAFRLERFI